MYFDNFKFSVLGKTYADFAKTNLYRIKVKTPGDYFVMAI